MQPEHTDQQVDAVAFPPFSREQLWRVVDSSSAAATLTDYFRPEAGPAAVTWTGGWFERLAGGGDRAQTANSITADDLVAVTMLGVQMPAAVCVNLLHGPLGEAIGSLLVSIPVDVALEDAEAELVRTGSSADMAWHLLTEQHGVDWVIAGKLLARKRPQLVPVYDNVVRCGLGTPGSFWESLRLELRRDDRRLAARLHTLRDDAGVPHVSAIRVLDVLLWRDHRIAHRAGDCAV